MKNKFSRIGGVLMIAAALALLPLSAQATPYTWSATSTTSAWETSGNWTTAGAPNAYADTATINNTANNPISLSGTSGTLGTVLLGGGGTALTIGPAGSSTIADLDIASGGTLGMQGNIFITTPTTGGTVATRARSITIEGTLRNDGASGTFYSISGLTTSGHGAETLTLKGGTISSLNAGSGWTFTSPITVGGYGTISSLFSGTGVVTANAAGQILHITNPNESISASSVSSSVAGAILSLEGTSLTAGTLSHTGEVDLNGVTMTGVSINNTTGTVNMTGDVTLVNNGNSVGSNGAFNFNGHTLNMTGATPGFAAISAITMGTGTLNNATNVTALLTQGAYNLAGGSITSTGGGSIQGGGIYGWGTISAPLIPIGSSAIVQASGSGHTLFITGPVDFTSGGNLVSSSGATLDLHSTINSDASPGGFINPNGGTVNLNAATLNGLITMRTGTVKVTDDSTMTGTINSESTLGINSGKTLNMSGATVNLNNGSLNNLGTLAVGGGTLNNATAGAYILGGAGTTTWAGGTIKSTGGGGFTSDNTVSGYGDLTTLFTNNGSMNISGGTVNVTGSGQIKGTGGVTISGSGLNLQNANTFFASNFSMGPTATLAVGTSTLHPLMELTGDYSFSQTDPLKWTHGTAAGLGPDLKMAGTGVQTLEVGGVNYGPGPTGFSNNFALNSLTIAPGATVQLVDLFSNAGTAGSEVLYLGALLLGGAGDPTFDLNGILCYVDGVLLGNGDYNGITVIDAAVPIPPSAMLLGTGLLGLLGLGWRRKKLSQA